MLAFLAIALGCTAQRDAGGAAGASEATLAGNAQGSELASADACRLSAADKSKAVRTFAELMPVFNHPRCANCHFGIDVYAESAEQLHGGGRMPKDEDGAIPLFDPACGTCHDAVPRLWMQPRPEMGAYQAGMSAAEICETIKSGSPDFLLEHIRRDRLIGAAFEGRRGHTELAPAPPPMTREAFEARIAAWVEAQRVRRDDRWPDPRSCGCTLSDSTYRVVYRQRYQSEKRGLAWDVTYRADLAPNTAEDPQDQLIGEGRYQGVVKVVAANCTNPLHPPKTVQVSGKLTATGGVADGLMSFVLATTDWKILPIGGIATTPEEEAAASGAGTVAELLLPLTGRTTTRKSSKPISDTDCDGVVTRFVDLSVEQRGYPPATPDRR